MADNMQPYFRCCIEYDDMTKYEFSLQRDYERINTAVGKDCGAETA